MNLLWLLGKALPFSEHVTYIHVTVLVFRTVLSVHHVACAFRRLAPTKFYPAYSVRLPHCLSEYPMAG